FFSHPQLIIFKKNDINDNTEFPKTGYSNLEMKKMVYTLKQFMPLITFVVPSIIISTILFIFLPTEWYLIVGFVVLLVMASFSYYMGIKGVLKEKESDTF
ncbi:MAG: hypothetical protein ACTSQ2_14825, partial [Candidatus Heimdallarchaeaceae archaeon]